MTDDLGDDVGAALRRYAAPAPMPADGTRRVLDRLARRRRRRTAVAAAGATAVLLVGVGVVAGLGNGGDAAQEPADRNTVAHDAPGPWAELPAAPLAPRHESVGAWTGSELVVVGGRTGFICPPGADCAGPDPSSSRRDGAAYDPATDRWRPIADAPAPIASAQAVWSGSEVVVTASAGVFAYDPTTDGWRTLDPQQVPTESAPPVVTPQGIVFSSYSQLATGGSRDLVLDPEDGTWARLPRDPFGESYDRSVAWDGERLWLLSMAVENHFEASDGASSRLAVLEGGLTDGTWRVVDDQTPDVAQGQLMWWSDGRLVVTPRYRSGGQVFDPVAGSWSAYDTPADPAGCALPPLGAGDHWVAGGGPVLVDADGGTTQLGACPALADPDVAVWAGDELIVWGGPDADYSGGSATGYRTGGEPAPCPPTLARAPRETYGFGTSEPAATVPDLPVPDEAWVCAYTTVDVSPPGSNGAWFEWRLSGPPVRLEGAASAEAAADLDDLRVPADSGCSADLGPRYLLSYRSGERTIGVVVDDYGCREVRLTDDPAGMVPGESSADGLVRGVLEGPDGLAERLARVVAEE